MVLAELDESIELFGGFGGRWRWRGLGLASGFFSSLVVLPCLDVGLFGTDVFDLELDAVLFKDLFKVGDLFSFEGFVFDFTFCLSLFVFSGPFLFEHPLSLHHILHSLRSTIFLLSLLDLLPNPLLSLQFIPDYSIQQLNLTVPRHSSCDKFILILNNLILVSSSLKGFHETLSWWSH